MWAELRAEVWKLVRKPRTWIGPVCMAAMIGLVTVGMKHGGKAEFGHIQGAMEENFVMTGSIVNAAFMSTHLLEIVMFTFLPLFACMVCGDSIASEAAEGTLRTTLCRPVSRLGVLLAKYAVVSVYVLALVVGTGLLTYLIGVLALGHGSLVNIDRAHGEIWIIPERDAIYRLVVAYALTTAGMLAVGSIAFAVSTFVSNSNGAIAAAMGVLYGSAVLEAISYFAWAKPYLITTYLASWRGILAGPPDMRAIAHSAVGLLAYAAMSLAIATAAFCRRDVLS